MRKHEDHKKRRLYVRNQESNSKQWESTELFICDCGAVLEKTYNKKKVIKQ